MLTQCRHTVVCKYGVALGQIRLDSLTSVAFIFVKTFSWNEFQEKPCRFSDVEISLNKQML